jgi:hypothetical protein
MMGYSVLYYLQHQSLEREISRAIDAEKISDEDLQVVKIPLTFYPQGDRGFERAVGSFRYQGKYYEMVKRKIENDTIYVYCLINQKKEVLVNKLARHIQTHIADVKSPQPGKSQKSTVPGFIKEYLRGSASALAFSRPDIAVNQFNTSYLSLYLSPAPVIPCPPPESN